MTTTTTPVASRRAARAYAVLTWAYAAGFGLSVVPVSVHLLRRGSLPWFGDLFPMYGGPWSERLPPGAFAGVLGGYLGLVSVVSWAAWRTRGGSRRAAVVSVALLPAEAVFWLGFALPIPWVLGAGRAALLIATLRHPARQTGEPPVQA